MKDLRGKVAAITGAASGIGRELALAVAREGGHVAMADVDERGLEETRALLTALGAKSAQRLCDVSRPEEVEAFAVHAEAALGPVDLVFNNAGVAVAGPIWTTTAEDWDWVIGINLMGVVHGIRAFVPRMLSRGAEGHVVNTASAAGLVSVPGSSVYCASKHAVVAISEVLQHELVREKAPVGVSVLCPAFIPTRIHESERNRPAALAATNPRAGPWEERTKKAVLSGRLSAAEVASLTIEAVKAGRFYVIPHQKIKGAVAIRMEDILQQRAPTDTVPKG